MSLGLPDFSSTRRPTGRGPWSVIQSAGYLVLAYVVIVTASEWWKTRAETESLDRARTETAQAKRVSDDTRRALQKNADLLVAAQSLESSPAIVLSDLEAVRPDGVSVISIRMEYQAEGPARLELTVVARSPEVYDRFLTALTRSESFADIKPGSESRPGSVRAVVTAVHRPKPAAALQTKGSAE